MQENGLSEVYPFSDFKHDSVCGGIIYGQSNIPIDSIAFYKGEVVTICDSVYETKLDAKSGITFLDIGGNFPKQPLTVVIFKKDAPAFPEQPESIYRNKNVCVTGRITEYKGKLQIVVQKPQEIVVE